MMSTYRIVRMYKGDDPHRIIKTGLTLKEAQAHCKDPETSSSTCAELNNMDHTREHGDWFDGYEEE